jgi:Sel1 repeat-containing protein
VPGVPQGRPKIFVSYLSRVRFISRCAADVKIHILLRAAILAAAVLAAPAIAQQAPRPPGCPLGSIHDCLLRAADLGSPTAAARVASAYQFGTDTFPRNPAKALHYYGIAAEHGNGNAAALLALEFYTGANGVPQDYVSAYAWMIVASGLGEDVTPLRDMFARSFTNDGIDALIRQGQPLANAITARILANNARKRGY